jgi:hypothetical protein
MVNFLPRKKLEKSISRSNNRHFPWTAGSAVNGSRPQHAVPYAGMPTFIMGSLAIVLANPRFLLQPPRRV